MQTKSLVAISSAATTATAVFATTAATTTARALFARLGDVNREVAPVQCLAIQAVDGLLGLLGCAHGNEAKPARTAGGPVHHQVGLDDRAVRGERVLQVVFSGVEGKIPDEQFITHVMFAVLDLNFAFSRLFPIIGFKIITELSSPEDLPCRENDKLSNRRL